MKNKILPWFVLLLTVLVFSILWADIPGLAESHITTTRFAFCRVMFVVGIAGLFVAWAAGKRFRYSLLDAVVWIFLLYIWGCSLAGEGVMWRTRLLMLLGALYFFFRLLAACHRHAPRMMQSAFLLVVIVEGIYGFCQLYGWLPSGHSLYRLTGSFFNPGPYSGFLVIALPIALNRILASRGRHLLEHWTWRRGRMLLQAEVLIAWVCLMLIIALLPAGMSRSSWLAAGAGCIFVAVGQGCLRPLSGWFVRNRKKAMAFAVAGVLAAGLLFAGIYHLKKDSADGRLLIWKVALSAMHEHPWKGVGPGCWGGAYGKAQAAYFVSGQATPQEEFVAGTPEYGFNEFLQIGVETGLVGLLLFLLMTGMALYGGGRSRRPESPAVTGGLCSFLVFACFSYPFSVLPLGVTFMLLLALSVSDRGPAAARWKVMLIAFVILGMILGTALPCLKLRGAYAGWRDEQTYFSMEIYERTVDHYARLYPLLSQEPRFLFEYGQCLSKTGNYEESNRILGEGLHYSADPMFYNIMGKNEQALEHYDQAARYFRQAACMVPNRLYPLYLLACMYFDTGQYEKAREVALLLLEKEPKVMSDAVLEMKQDIKERMEAASENTIDD